MDLRHTWRGPLALAVLAVLAFLSAGSALSANSSKQTDVEYAAWPLGPDGSIPRALYSTHGQFWSVSGQFLHQGIDISACPGEPVFAVEDGTVVYSSFGQDGNSEYQYLIVSRGGDTSHGMLYLHLGDSVIDVGDEVKRDQLIGTVVNWTVFCSYDHLHLQVVKCSVAPSLAWPVATALDAGNPLCQFDPSADHELPTCGTLPSQYSPTPVKLLFFKNKSDAEKDQPDEELVPTQLKGDIDIVASFEDLCFSTKPPNDPSSAACVEASSFETAPYKASLTIKKLDSSGAWVPITDVFQPIVFGCEAERTNLASIYYQGSSVGTYSTRDLRLILTHGSGQRASAWSPVPGEYLVQVELWDRADNHCSADMRVTVL